MADFVMAPVGAYQVAFTLAPDDKLLLERTVEVWPVIAFDATQAPLLMGAQALVSPNSIHEGAAWTLAGGGPTTVFAGI